MNLAINQTENILSEQRNWEVVFGKVTRLYRQHVTVQKYLVLASFSLPRLELLLHLFDDAEGCVEIGRGRRDLSRLLRVGAPIRAATTCSKLCGPTI